MKIPEDVFENRCRYCFHGRTENGNKEIPDEHLFSSYCRREAPCNILGICKANEVQGECLSFHPTWIYGLCLTCLWNNQFRDGFCAHPGGPVNKQRVYLGNGGITGISADYWQDHVLCTCDRYKVMDSLKGYIQRDTLNGRAPANFNPDTWEPLEPIEGNPMAKRWELMKEEARQAAEEKARAEVARKLEAIAKAKAPEEAQISFFEED